MTDRTVDDVLLNAREALDLARRGLGELLEAKGRHRAAGLRNLAVWGRVTTQTLHKLESIVGSSRYEDWWAPLRKQMQDDPGFKYLWDLRNQVEKEGDIGPVFPLGVHIGNTGCPGGLADMPRPPHASSFFFGDPWGGSGWEIELPDGTKGKLYVDIPETWGVEMGELKFLATTTSQKIPPPTESVEGLARRYGAFLQEVLEPAIRDFSTAQ